MGTDKQSPSSNARQAVAEVPSEASLIILLALKAVHQSRTAARGSRSSAIQKRNAGNRKHMLTGYANEANRNIPGGYTQSATGMPSGSAPDESGGLPHKDEPRIVKVRTKRG